MSKIKHNLGAKLYLVQNVNKSMYRIYDKAVKDMKVLACLFQPYQSLNKVWRFNYLLSVEIHSIFDHSNSKIGSGKATNFKMGFPHVAGLPP